MEEELGNLLQILGFNSELQEVPSLTKIRRQFHKECLIKHPDRPTGSKEKFQELLSAYKKILKRLSLSSSGEMEDKWTFIHGNGSKRLVKKFGCRLF